MKTSTKLLSMFSAFCALFLLGMTANAQSITVTPGLTATQMAQALVGSNVTVTNATYSGAATASGSFNQASSTFPITDGIILTSGNINNALGPNNSTGSSAVNNTAGDPALLALTGGINTFDAAVLEFDITSNCNTVTFDYIFASEEYLEYGCSNFNDAFAFFITGPGYTPNTNLALVPGTNIPVSINNVINDPSSNCVSNPAYYVDNAGGVAMQYDGRTVLMTATATIQPCQTYHIKIVVADAGDSALDSAIFLKGGGINCTSPGVATTANITGVDCAGLGSIDLSVNSGTGPFVFTWTGPNGFTATTEDISGLQAGNYTVEIVGADCLSSGEETFTVPDNSDVTPPVLNCAGDISLSGCVGTVDVLANITATDDCAVASITTTHDATYQFGLGITPVTVTATDVAGNTSSCTFNVVVTSPPLTLNLTPTVYAGGWNVRCFGGNTGRVTGTAAGGCAPYTYSWSAGSAFPFPVGGSTCTGLFAGAVSCTVTDAAGNTVTQTVTLNEAPPLVMNASFTPISCFGGTSTVTLSVSGGTLNAQGGYNGNTLYSNVSAGTYNYTVADGNGCRAYDTITITQPAILEATANATQILCYGDSSNVTVSATGGTMPYTGTGVIPQVAGTYMYNVVDANGCSDQIGITITQPGQLTAMASNTPISCYGDSSWVTVTVISGTEPYTGTGTELVPAGTYTYTVYDYNLCEDEVTITVTQPTQMVATATATPILCAGDSSTIVVTGQGGTGAWTGTGTFVEPAGTYGYGFTDANGCVDSISITVSEPSALSVSATAGSILCNGGTADVTVTASGGTAPYSGVGTFNVGAGTYTYTITDANGCTATTSVTLTEPDALQAFASCPGILCNGGTTNMGVTAFGGTPPYSGTGVFNVGAGTYTYTITDANGCTTTVTHTITEPAPLVLTATSTSIDCAGGTADVTVIASGGTPGYTGTGTFTGLSAGTYSYTVADANGCTETVSITITEPSALSVLATTGSILCNGGTADVTVTATGGTAPYSGVGTFNVGAGTYTYTVTDANGCTATTSVTLTEPDGIQAFASCPAIDCAGGTADMAVFAFGGTPPYSGTGIFNVGAGTYTYAITDANGCTATVTHTVTEPAPLVLTATSTSIECAGGTADVTVTASGGTPGYTGTGTFTGLSAGTYSYTVTDANGCTETVSITITEPSALSVSATATTIDCNGGTAEVTVTATGGMPSYTGTGTFTVTAGTHDFTVTDANGCSTTVSVTVTEPSALVVSASSTSILCNGGTADVIVSATGGTPPYTGTTTYTVGGGTYTYTVTDANGCTSDVTVTVIEPSALTATATVGTFDCSTSTSDITVVAAGGTAPYSGTGTYTESEGTYTYAVTDANGCSVTVSATVETQNFVDLVCPGDQVYACESNQTCGGTQQGSGAIVSWDEPTASSFGTCSSGCGPVQCINGFQYIGEFGGSRYYRSYSSNYSWQQANVAATNAGGHLATIGSAAENSFIASQMGCSYAWIGYTDQNAEGTFEWVTGENLSYENWAGSEPNNNGPVPNGCSYCGQADYTVIVAPSGAWYDRYECNQNQFIMEIPCGNPITITQTSGPASGTFVQGGTSQVVTYVATDNVTGATATCSFTVTVEECVPVYCQSSGSCTAYEWIESVSLGMINNQSGNDGGYGDYTSMSTVASVGDVVNLSLTPGFSGTPYTEAWRIWVDWNYDGDFNDQGEFIGQGTGTSTLTGSFTVPSYATLNKNLRVRISMRWDCYAGSCSNFQYGEVEDYTIVVLDNGGINSMSTTILGEEGNNFKQPGAPNNTAKSFDEGVEDVEMEGGIGLELKDIYPNPVLASNGTFNLDIRSGSKSDVMVRIVDLSGKVMMTEYMLLEIGANKRSIDVTGFARGSYLVEVISGDLKESTQLIVQ